MTTFRILVADELSPEGLEILDAAGEAVVKTGMDEATLRDTLPGFHALVVRSATKVTAASLEKAVDLAVIGRAGIGIDNIDVAAATERGIVVMNSPDATAVTTGEHAIALLASMSRHIPAADASMKAGRWEKKTHVGSEMRRKTLGVLGLGRIGTVVADRGVGLRMNVVAHDPVVKETALAGVRLVSFEELLAESDYLSIHVPRNEKTLGLINAEAIAKMKKGARLINCARGGIIDEDALCDALDSGHLAGAALDVYTSEPLGEDSRLRRTAGLVLTPHLGASTAEAKRGVSVDMARQIVTCLETGVALNGINVARITATQAQSVGPYLKLIRNLASFLSQVFEGPLESVRVTLQGELPQSAEEPLTVAAVAGALHPRSETPVTTVNALRVATEQDLRVFTETSSLKRDFVNVVRVEAVIGGERHQISGTVLGHRHGRMVDLDNFMLDAIPEGPLLVTFHRDAPGMVGGIGCILGEENVNIARIQLGTANDSDVAIAIWNLTTPLTDHALQRVIKEIGVARARRVI